MAAAQTTAELIAATLAEGDTSTNADVKVSQGDSLKVKSASGKTRR